MAGMTEQRRSEMEYESECTVNWKGHRERGYLKDAFGKTDRVFLKDRGFIGRLFEFGWQVIDVFDADHDRRAALIQGIGCPQFEYVLRKQFIRANGIMEIIRKETGKECKKRQRNMNGIVKCVNNKSHHVEKRETGKE